MIRLLLVRVISLCKSGVRVRLNCKTTDYNEQTSQHDDRHTLELLSQPFLLPRLGSIYCQHISGAISLTLTHGHQRLQQLLRVLVRRARSRLLLHLQLFDTVRREPLKRTTNLSETRVVREHFKLWWR